MQEKRGFVSSYGHGGGSYGHGGFSGGHGGYGGYGVGYGGAAALAQQAANQGSFINLSDL